VAGLKVEVSANVARIAQDMEAVARTVESQLARVDAFIEKSKIAFGALGASALVGFSFEAITEKINGAIEAAGQLENLAARTGATVEGLSSLAAVARLSGTDTEQLATGLTKLDKSLSALNADSPKSVAAFASIGLSAKDFIGLSADQAFQKVAVAMAGYADGVEKTAAAQLIFGKAGAALIPVLRDTAEAGDLVAVVTAKQAHEAEEYEKTLRKLTLATDSVFRQIGLAAVPAMESFARAMLEATSGADSLNSSVKTLAADNSITTWAEGAAKTIAFVVDAFDGVGRVVLLVGHSLGATAAQAVALVHGDFAAIAEIEKADQEYGDSLLNKPLFSDRLATQFAERQRLEAQQGPPEYLKNKPAIGGSATEAGDAKAVLDQALKTLQAFIAAENDLLKQRDDQLKRLYDDNRLSIHDYFAGLQTDQEKHLAEVFNAYEREIAAVNDYIAHAETKKEKDAGYLRVLELQAQQSRAIQTEGAALAKITDEDARATEAYTARVLALNVQLLTQQGHLAEAARLQAADASLKFRQRAALEPGGADVLAGIDASDKAKTDAGAINDLKNQAALIEERLATTVGRTNLEVSTGHISELDGLARTDVARRAQIAQLEQIADNYLQIAATVNDQGKSTAAAEAFKLKIDELAASTDSLGKKFNDVFETDFATGLDKVIQGTESVTQAFRSMFNSIFAQLSQMASKDLAKQIFGGGSEGGSAGGGGLIGGLVGLLGGAGATGEGLGGGIGEWLDLAALSLGFQSGTPYVPKDMLARVHEGERIIPADENNSYSSGGGAWAGGNTTIHVHMPAGQPVTRESMALTGAAAARALAVSHARNN